jgi:hypothetical protein
MPSSALKYYQSVIHFVNTNHEILLVESRSKSLKTNGVNSGFLDSMMKLWRYPHSGGKKLQQTNHKPIVLK